MRLSTQLWQLCIHICIYEWIYIYIFKHIFVCIYIYLYRIEIISLKPLSVKISESLSLDPVLGSRATGLPEPRHQADDLQDLRRVTMTTTEVGSSLSEVRRWVTDPSQKFTWLFEISSDFNKKYIFIILWSIFQLAMLVYRRVPMLKWHLLGQILLLVGEYHWCVFYFYFFADPKRSSNYVGKPSQIDQGLEFSTHDMVDQLFDFFLGCIFSLYNQIQPVW